MDVLNSQQQWQQQSAYNHDEPVAVLGQRYPLLLADVSHWVQRHPADTRVAEIRPMSRIVQQGRLALLYNCHDPESILNHLNSQQSCVHLFPEVSGFLQFLTRPESRLCLTHEKWQPLLLLPLQHATHLRHFLASVRPEDWPWALLDQRVFTNDPADMPARNAGLQMLQLLQILTRQLADKLRDKYANRPTPRDVMHSRARALRVLALAYRGSSYQQFCARDIADGFNATGQHARALILSGGPARHYDLLQAIDEFDPDVLLLNGRARKDCEGLPSELSVISWDQDYALSMRKDLAASMMPRDRLLLMVQDWEADARSAGIPAEKTHYVNLGANLSMYRPAARVAGKAEYDVLFVGNYYPWQQYRAMIGFDALEPAAQRIMLLAREKLAAQVRGRRGDHPDELFVLPDLDALLRQCCAELKIAYAGGEDEWRFLVRTFRYRVAHLLIRELYVSQLAEFRLGLFGHGWDAIPALAGIAQPEIENGAPLCAAIHRSAINLHLHTWTAHHPRLYDTAAAGGFLLVGRVDEINPLDRVFAVGEELDSFGSIAELKRKIRFYLENEDLRREIAARAASRVRREHTMRRRMAQVTEILSAP